MLRFRIDEVILKSESNNIEILIYNLLKEKEFKIVSNNRKSVLEYLELFDTQNFDSTRLLSLIEIV